MRTAVHNSELSYRVQLSSYRHETTVSSCAPQLLHCLYVRERSLCAHTRRRRRPHIYTYSRERCVHTQQAFTDRSGLPIFAHINGAKLWRKASTTRNRRFMSIWWALFISRVWSFVAHKLCTIFSITLPLCLCVCVCWILKMRRNHRIAFSWVCMWRVVGN